MGPVNWFGVLAATLVALAVSALWYGPVHGRARLEELGPGGLGQRIAPGRTILASFVLLLVSATMIGHMFARVGPATLAIKPWLYFMMTGGLAGAFIIPAMWINYMNLRVSRRLALIDAGFWLLAYLAMGLTFFLMAPKA
jgi:predicted outer membrane lipoprotein